MDKRAEPSAHSMRAPELLLPNHDVQAPVPILRLSCIEKLAQCVLLHPVDLKVTKRPPVPAPDHGKGMFGFQVAAQELLLDLNGAITAPGFGDAGVIHPLVKELEVGHLSGVDLSLSWRVE